ncbi:MAG: hypothetical protein ACKOXI_04510 [Candidatus Planktophila sp.]
MRRLTSLVMCVAFVANILLITNADAAETLKFSNSTTCSGWGPGTTTWAYRMYASSAENITSMEVPFVDATGASNTQLAIYSSVGGAPGQLLGTFNYVSYVGGIVRFTGNASVGIGDFYWVYYSSVSSNPCSAGSQANTTGSGWTMSKYRYQGSNGAGPFNYDSVGTTASMLQLKIYTGVTDSTPPTFLNSETFLVAENSTSVGAITSSESATISIFGGLDQSKFSLARIDSSSASLSFISPPNFEIPTDVGLDNSYQVVLKAIDSAGNAGYDTVTATVSDVDENARVLSYAITGTPTKGSAATINAVVSAVGKVTFTANGKRIPNCISKLTSGSGPITVSCTWKPSTTGITQLGFKAVPSAANYFSISNTLGSVNVTRRSNNR